MIKKEKIEELAAGFLEGTDRFLVRVSVGKDNRINIYLDGDHGVTIADCARLSRQMEEALDRDAEDFELNVLSAGVGEPFLLLRQYLINRGRPVEVLMHDGSKKKGILEDADENEVVLKELLKAKNKKSKKMIAGEPVRIRMSEIRQTRAIVVF